MNHALRLVSVFALTLCIAWQNEPPRPPQEGVPPAPPGETKTTSAGQQQPAPAEGERQPRITLSSESWDFGTLVIGETPSHTVTLKNEGDADLTLEYARGSCACTVPELKTKLLKPGESTEITITFNTKKRQGNINTMVQIKSNDPVRPIVTYRVTGVVKQLVSVEPATLNLNGTQRDEVLSGTVKIVNQSGEPIHPKVKNINSDFFDVQLKEVEPGNVYELAVTSRPPLNYGATRVAVEVETGVERQPLLQIPIHANVRARVSATPSIVFVPPQQNTASKRQIRIRYYGEADDFKILGAESRNPDLVKVTLKPAVQVSPAQAASEIWRPRLEQVLEVQAPAGSELPAEGVEIVVTTNDPDFKELVIPVTGSADVFKQILGIRTEPGAKAVDPRARATLLRAAGAEQQESAGNPDDHQHGEPGHEHPTPDQPRPEQPKSEKP